MSPEMLAFLEAEDLDDALSARRKIRVVSEGDAALVRTVLAEWKNRQAISNLLFHPALIPEDLRLLTLLRGLAERETVYFVLAAIVGFQSIEPKSISPEDRQRIASELLAISRGASGILAGRATVSFRGFLGDGDATGVFDLLSSADETVRHNARAWLFTHFGDRGHQAFVAAARASALPAEEQRRAAEEFAEFLARPPGCFATSALPLFGYIPNLRGVE